MEHTEQYSFSQSQVANLGFSVLHGEQLVLISEVSAIDVVSPTETPTVSATTLKLCYIILHKSTDLITEISHRNKLLYTKMRATCWCGRHRKTLSSWVRARI